MIGENKYRKADVKCSHCSLQNLASHLSTIALNIGGKGNYFSVSGSGDLNAKGDFMLINKNGGAKIEGGNANHAIYFNKGLNGDKNQLGFHGSDSINMYTGGNINKQKKRMTIDDEGTTTKSLLSSEKIPGLLS